MYAIYILIAFEIFYLYFDMHTLTLADVDNRTHFKIQKTKNSILKKKITIVYLN